ncbi:MAG: hypothetical protein IEMM0003_0298 [bacterium]|nr:MAG: hypothetical protein IEMM0003_0298 [bacterium]
MKITDYSQITAKYLRNEKAEAKTAVKKQNSAAGQTEKTDNLENDKVEISLYAMGARSIAADNKNFELRVDQLRQAVQNGKYTINAEKIAKLMLGI